MQSHQQHKTNYLVLVVLIIVVAVAIKFVYANLFFNKPSSNSEYASRDLGVSLSYPKDWYINEKDLSILLTSYQTRFGQNSQPSESQIKIFIDNFSGCHSTIEENLKDPACGEGGPSVKLNEITLKDSRETGGGTFYKYVVKSPNKQFVYYLLQNGERVLQISKQPDPSQYEKEFDEIFNSIRFLK